MLKSLVRPLALGALVTVACTAWAGDPDVLQEAKDRAEIEALMWRYARALDSFDAAAYAAVYTEDGQFGTGANAVKGRAALTKMIADLKKGRAEREAKGEAQAAMFHMTTDSYTEFVDKDHVRHHTYWLTVFGATGRESPPRVAAAGRGVDDLVRVNGQWLIKVRNVAPE
jgi:uncharacterized protein (TIGR02246 family)